MLWQLVCGMTRTSAYSCLLHFLRRSSTRAVLCCRAVSHEYAQLQKQLLEANEEVALSASLVHQLTADAGAALLPSRVPQPAQQDDVPLCRAPQELGPEQAGSEGAACALEWAKLIGAPIGCIQHPSGSHIVLICQNTRVPSWRKRCAALHACGKTSTYKAAPCIWCGR